jgi:phosphate-selective porin OprO and OprP
MRKIVLLVAAALILPAVSQAKTLEDILVEKGVITKSEAQSAKGGIGGNVTYSNEGTRFDFPSAGFTTGFQVFMQEAYTFTDNDEDAGESNDSSFDVKKARLALSGTALHEEFSYMLNADFVGDSDEDADGNSESSASLKDAYLRWHACDNGWVQMGQFKTGLTRQVNSVVNSSGRQMFADTSVAASYFDLGRQQGASGQWTFSDGMIVLGAGIFNGESTGEGENRTGVDTHHTGVVNLRVNALGKMDSYTEGDIGWTQDMALSFGAGYANSSIDAGADNVDVNTIAVDANLKFKGLGLHAEYFYGDQDDGDINPSGFYAQAGYFIDPKTLELAAGYSMIECDDGTAGGICSGNDNVNEAKFGINYYWTESHNIKAQLNYIFRNQDLAGSDGDDINTNIWLLQLTQYI